MRNIKFSEVFNNACLYAGRDYTQMDSTELARMVSFINARVRHGWDYADWPELRICEERYFRNAWQVGSSYVAGDEVYHAGAYYECQTNDTGTEPGTNAAVWTEVTELDRYIPWIMADRYPIGTVYAVTKENPYAHADRRYTFDFTPGREGIWIHDCNLDSVWMIHRPRASKYTHTAHSGTGSYSNGDLVYMSTYGEVFQAALVAGVQTWVKVEFPAFLADYVGWAAAGDWLRWNGEPERADRAWALADQMLDDLRARELDQPGQSIGMTVKGAW